MQNNDLSFGGQADNNGFHAGFIFSPTWIYFLPNLDLFSLQSGPIFSPSWTYFLSTFVAAFIDALPKSDQLAFFALSQSERHGDTKTAKGIWASNAFAIDDGDCFTPSEGSGVTVGVAVGSRLGEAVGWSVGSGVGTGFTSNAISRGLG